MKLVSCHVVGYGKIKNETFAFKDGANVILRDNGYGKTTLASFIKAMFYGLKPYKKNTDVSTAIPERLNYYPFDAGKFGGNLTFIKDGSVYRIERFFGKKSDTEDELKVYKDGELCEEFSKNLGEEIFGLSEEAFVRTLFIDSSNYRSSGEGIKERLGSFSDDKSCTEALDVINSEKKIYKTKANAKSLGKIDEAKKIIAALQDEILDLERLDGGLNDKYARLNRLKSGLSAANKNIETAKSLEVIEEKRKRYEFLNARLLSAKRRKEEFDENYPSGLPAESEITTLNATCLKLKELSGQNSVNRLSENDEFEYKKLCEKFKNGAPSTEQVDTIRTEFEDLKTDLERLELKQIELSKRKECLNADRFYKKDVEADVKIVERLAAEYTAALNGGNNSYNRDLGENGKKESKVLKSSAVTFFLSVLLLAIGVFAAFYNKTVGIIIAVLSGVVAILSGVMYLSKKSKENKILNRGGVSANRSHVDDAKNAIIRILGKYGYGGADFLRAAYGFISDYNANIKTLREIDDLDLEIQTLTEKTNLIKQKLEREISCYAPFADRDFKTTVTAFIRDSERFVVLRRSVGLLNQKQSGNKAEEVALINVFRKTFDKYGLEFPTGKLSADVLLAELRRISGDSSDGQRIANDYYAALEDFNSYAAEFKDGTNDLKDNASFDLSKEMNDASVFQSEISSLEREIATDEDRVELLSGKKALLENKKCELNEFEKKYEILNLAEDFLIQAEKSFVAKYTEPVQNAYKKYASLINKKIADGAVLSKRLEPEFEAGGELRQEGFLSEGERAVSSLCFRLAVIDVIFKGDFPFVIMDDPFCYLDEKNLDGVRGLIKNLSSDAQIIYFCCHQSRRL